MTAPAFQHFYANLKDVRLHYVTVGQGRPVVFFAWLATDVVRMASRDAASGRYILLRGA